MEKNPHLCDPQTKEKERGKRSETWNKKIKKSFGNKEKVSTFADPNGRELRRAKEVEAERVQPIRIKKE